MAQVQAPRLAGSASAVLAVLAAAQLLAACGGGPPAVVPTPSLTEATTDRDQLAGLAAAAKDRRYVAQYTLSVPGRDDRTVTVALATDGTWVVAVPGGALGGLADIAIYGTPKELYQCALGPAAQAATVRPDLAPTTPGCVRVSHLTRRTDPRVQHIFLDWIDPLLDRATALSVAATDALPRSSGSCFSVESSSAALAPPVDPGVYCYRSDGVLDAARVSFGTLVLAGAVAAAPPSVTMPAPVVDREPLPMAAPPMPAPSSSP